MTPETIAAIVAVVGATVTLASLPFVVQSARAAARQTRLQERIARDSAQPYVWADLAPDGASGVMLRLSVTNAGPTVATNVRVGIEPSLNVPFADEARAAEEVLARGIPALAPGRSYKWNLGTVWDAIEDTRPGSYVLTIGADGPFGAIPPLTYEVNIRDIRMNPVEAPGSLDEVRDAIKSIATEIKKRPK